MTTNTPRDTPGYPDFMLPEHEHVWDQLSDAQQAEYLDMAAYMRREYPEVEVNVVSIAEFLSVGA